MKKMGICFIKGVFFITLMFNVGVPQESKHLTTKVIQTNFQNLTGIITLEESLNESSHIKQIVRTDNALLFCDKNFNAIDSISIKNNTRITCSKSLKYLLLDDQSINEKNYSEVKRKLTLIDSNGKEFWSKPNLILGEDEQISFIPSDYNGNVFKVDYAYSTITTISIGGNIINKVELFGNPEYTPGRRLYMDISKSGEYYVVLAEKIPSHERTASGAPIERFVVNNKIIRTDTMKVFEKEVGEPSLFLFNNDGILINEMEVKGEQPSNVFINNDGTMILYITTNLGTVFDNFIISLINKDFEELFSTSISGSPINVLFKKDILIITYLDGINNKFKLVAFNINTGKFIWANELQNVPVSLEEINQQSFSLLTCSDVKRQLQSEYFIYNVFDINGKYISQLEIGYINNEYLYSVKPEIYFNNQYFIKNKQVNMINVY